MRNERHFNELVGLTLSDVAIGAKEVVFTTADGKRYRLAHGQDCCETVVVEDVIGDVNDLVGSPIIMSDESGSNHRPDDLPPLDYPDESQTWTFYKLATVKGYVTIRFYGSSNGYYSESVDFELMEAE